MSYWKQIQIPPQTIESLAAELGAVAISDRYCPLGCIYVTPQGESIKPMMISPTSGMVTEVNVLCEDLELAVEIAKPDGAGPTEVITAVSVVWVVQYSNYSPAEINSIHATSAGAETKAAELGSPWPLFSSIVTRRSSG